MAKDDKPEVEDAAAAFEGLATAIMRIVPNDQPLTQWGWNLAPLTRNEVAEIPRRTAVLLRGLPPTSITDELAEFLLAVPARIRQVQQSSLQHLPGGNGFHVVAQIEQLSDAIERMVPPAPPPRTSIDWKEVASKGQLPPELLRRLRSVEASLKAIEPRTGRLADQVGAIEAAHEAAESLPTDMASLAEARTDIEAAGLSVQEALADALQSLASIKEAADEVRQQETEAKRLVENCGEAYRVTTTKGLAASFSKRAMWLNISVVLWVGGLLIALGIGAYLAFLRLEAIQTALGTNVPTDRIWIHVALAVLSVGAPVWFAWIATKQIGQRFRLAEDYAFKASVAKAYEGYRREAARIDPVFESRLFSSALSRLEEAPLRLVEHESYGSPWHELTNSPAFQKALNVIPELKEKYLGLLPPALRGGRARPAVDADAGTSTDGE